MPATISDGGTVITSASDPRRQRLGEALGCESWASVFESGQCVGQI